MMYVCISIIVFFSGLTVGFIFAVYRCGFRFYSEKKKTERLRLNLKLLDRFMSVIERGQDVTVFFERRNISSVAVYGIGILGRHFLKNIDTDKISISFVVDREVGLHQDFRVYDVNDEWPSVDALIVTPVLEYQEIKQTIQNKMGVAVYSIEEIISDCEKGL